MTTILCAVFFLSGASALIFESLWFQLSGLTFGNSVWATSIVLSSFMAGLALGNLLVTIKGYKIKSPIHFYALLEIVIAITGLGLVLAFPYLTKIFVPLFRVIIDHPLLLNATRAAIAMGLMIIPATAMGMTLPLLVKALYKENPNFGRVLGLLYGWNTLGAVAGVMVSELYLIKWFGIRGAGMAAAFFNLIAAFTALWLSKRFTQSYPAQTISEPKPIRFHISFESGRILIAGFLSGFILLALEVIWFRFMILFWDPNSYNFAVMLAVVLGGISLGGICASRLFTIKKDVHHFLPEVFFTNALLIIILYTNFSQVIKWLENLSKYPNIVIASLILMFPISFVSGIIFTMLGRALHIKIIGETKTTGLLTFANTIGGMTGSLVAGLLLIPVMGLEKSYLILSCMYGMTGFLLFLKKQHRFANIAFAATFLISLAIFPFNIMVSQYLDVSIPPSLRDSDEKRVAFREGMTETIQYLRYDLLKQPDYYRLITNSYSMSGTNKYSKRYMKLYVYWPMAIHPNPQKALLICYGCGSTAKAMTDSKKLKSIDIVDTSKDVIEMGSIVYPDPKENPVNDPRVNIHIEDGRFFLLTNEKQYDLITAEPPPPKNSGVVNLYSQEYFQLAYNRLSDGGIMTYWLPVYQLKPEETKSILKAFTNVFKETSLWVGTGFEWMMVGIKNPDKKASMNDSFEAQWKDPVVGVEMRSVGFMSPEQFGSLFIADSERLENWIANTLPLMDDFPRRLSRGNIDLKDLLIGYREFMNPIRSRENFKKSKDISKIWPEEFKKASLPYFQHRQIINEILMGKRMRSISTLAQLHECLTIPLLSDYILWVFNSDLKAQRILKDYLKNQKKIDKNDVLYVYHHLAAAAALKKDYILTEKYLAAAMKVSLSENSKLYYTGLRMYFLMVSDQMDQAMKAAQEYVNLYESDRAEREKKIAGYWNWMVKALDK